ncbi:DUF221-domain-containing protein [Lindgomyces ingoldianus]|uniref:DUF221-domain-containing protein n=1 Tax=Lindgomyces ingoldianus TaxID=673940 RepID=A0ACB6QST4_9PLEO|nr:DUF221-domain-containing protein [Lindgomyces ingoldianus]KAF2470089.1 DUF221-domain-containing protein [Lindgomyces ingoldianus]
MSSTDVSARATSTDAMAGNAGAAQANQNQSIENFAASLSTAAVIFGVQILAFLLLSGNWKLRKSKTQPGTRTERQSLFHKIYYYKAAFVSKSKRIKEPTTAIESFRNVFTISDRELIRVAGVDGYLFLQYLQLLLRIFIPMAFVILPVLLPVNRVGDVPGVSGLDSFSWPNVGVPQKVNRLWAHLVLAVCVILWVCYQFYLALRKFVRLRQTILTMPEHRIRASATTILVQTIPRKWLTVAALDALYDVFPGGIREIWINRNFDGLQEKVDKRTKIARTLESAETNLIIECTKKHMQMEAKRRKAAGIKKSKKEKKHDEDLQNQDIEQTIDEPGMSSGNPHQIEQALQQVLKESSLGSSSSSSSSRSSSPDSYRKRTRIPIVGQGIQAMGEGFRDVGHGVGKIGTKMVGGFRGAFGGKHEGQGPQQLDGPDDRPLSSPISAEYSQRGASTDTYAPLNGSTKDQYDKEGTASEPNSPQSTEKPQLQAPTMSKTDPLKMLKKSPLNPVRRISDFASPQPFHAEGEQFPLEEEEKKQDVTYDLTGIYKEDSAEDGEDALWRQYIKPKSRETMRVPLFDKTWWPSLPLIGKKVDTIYYCRKELARLNHEIADDQAHQERFPLMNSAFIQFNHQVAAHMACQSLSHHIPRQMAPRTVEVNPNYVLWNNLSMDWWHRYLRTTIVVIAIVGLVICWGIPVSFTGALSQISTLSKTRGLGWLAWLNTLPGWLISFIQGVLPPAFLALLFVVLPILLRFMAELTGVTTAGERELLVQNFYFAFVFIQLFLVVSISTGISATIDKLVNNPLSVPQTLAQNLPRSANYFYSYMILQALSISSGTLLQIAAVGILLISRWIDTTPRQKVSRILSRPGINWGNMIPVYTNIGAIGLIYSVVSPLIMIMMLITFGLFWFTYRYQMIYVSYAKAETNGLIFPKAINQLFTGLYFLELCLIGLFFIQDGPHGGTPCFPQGIIMIVMAGLTVLYQILINRAFGPLFKYLPITFEDDAVRRDEEFQRAQASRWQPKGDDEHRSLNSELEAHEKAEKRESQLLEEEDRRASKGYHPSESIEMKRMGGRRQSERLDANESSERPHKQSWANRSRSRSQSQSYRNSESHQKYKKGKHNVNPLNAVTNVLKSGLGDVAGPIRDIEAQTMPSAYLFDNIDDTLEDIEPDARQKLIARAFQHPATRAIQPAIWIPHDELGVAKDEISRTSKFSEKIWITSVNARLDASGKVMYKGLPPDRDPFENIEV